MLYASDTEWVSPSKESQDRMNPETTFLEEYQEDPPVNDARKVLVNDADHL